MSEEDLPDKNEPEGVLESSAVPEESEMLETTEVMSPIRGMYGDYFLEYASYVILERAVPSIFDGLKPVQRRILHAMRQMEDGRYNKVANIVGDTMRYHPHGNASIEEALVQLGQKNLLVDTQGNWGNIYTGDNAAAPRYIEARLTPFALDVLYNAKTTEWVLSYDGRRKEPVVFPSKFPILLYQGVEGIAVGLSCKILPHNFNEIIDASVAHLKGEPYELLPDFPTGGLIDASDYQDGRRGGRIRCRAKIEPGEKKHSLRITEVPYGVTTGSLMDSIVNASDKGKLKIVKVDDNTAAKVEIVIQFPPGTEMDKAEQALYAFTDCEVSIAPNTCVIDQEKPVFIGVSDLIRHTSEHTRELLRQELEIKLNELESDWHFSSLEKIFIEERIYRDIEECTTWEAVLQAIRTGLEPFFPRLRREVTGDDIIRLTEIKIKRISKYDSFKADEHLLELDDEIADVRRKLGQLTKVTIKWFEGLKKKYGKEHPRQSQLTSFERVAAAEVIQANETFAVNRTEGFAGIGMRKDDEFLSKCSPLDDFVAFREDGVMQVFRMAPKVFIGPQPYHVSLFRSDDQRVFHVIYRDKKDGKCYVKRFKIGGVTREREYPIAREPRNEILWFSVHANETESASHSVKVKVKAGVRGRKETEAFHFGNIPIKGRAVQGNLLSRNKVLSVEA